MEDREYEDLEAEALGVVQVLNSLKDEIDQYKDAKLNTKKSLRALEKLVGAVSKAADELAQTARQVGESDYVSLCGSLDSRSQELEGCCNALNRTAAELPSSLSASIAAHVKAQEGVYASHLADMDKRIVAEQQERDRMLQGLDASRSSIEGSASKVSAALDSALATQEKLQKELVDSTLAALQERDQELLQRIAALEDVVGRIDRNTQKGFGKERG